MSEVADAPQRVNRVAVSDGEFVKIGARPSFWQYLRQIWAFRHFIWFDSRSRVSVGNYEDSLGLAWIIINPILNGLTYFLVFGLLLGTGRGVPNFIAYLIIGVFVFRFTSASVMGGARSINSNRALLRAFNFPRATLPIATNVRELLQSVPAYAAMFVMILLIPPLEPLTLWWFVIIPVTALQFAFNTGFSMILARLVALKNDFAHLIGVGLRIWMYLSAVFFSIERFENHPSVYLIMQFNPAYAFLDIVRQGILNGQSAGWLSWAIATSFAVAMAVVGLLVFWHGEETYGDER